MEYPVFDDQKDKLYKYYFHGIEQPVVIQATSREIARQSLRKAILDLDDKYRMSKVIGESVTVPARGVTVITKKGQRHIWVGKSKASDGWMLETEYKVKLKNNASPKN